MAQVKGMAEKLGVHINWKGRRDHLDPVLQDYQVCSTLTCAVSSILFLQLHIAPTMTAADSTKSTHT